MNRLLRYRSIWRWYERIRPVLKYSLPVESALPGRHVMVVAPHQDDEAIACGGALELHRRAGGASTVVYCTREGQPRDDEAHAACALLGATCIEYGFPVESLHERRRELAARLTDTIAAVRPDIVFLPWFIDNHADHRAVCSALFTTDSVPADTLVYAYAVWLPLTPTVLLDIGPARAAKEKAISCYRTQTATRDYLAMSAALERYWAITRGGGSEFLEPYFRCTAGAYADLVRGTAVPGAPGA